ncbi:GNAT family N-acetyltransferase [Umezawaea sp. Da 62-37]|uniref:GNAT family N-acetyltransferase n=1 Tax=Umezawaea sp. Da 62-37 TaxID=3075927 RepID=UPI0028F730A0|nr:GNAT family N-acetyltransferase [Umezawaea sp. Da 62-37]WNV85660.1 GNAT family N-acetyltransferase [Umezawaea sp. Da 62-37]
MRSDGWHLTEDLDEFLARAGEFLRSRPALHTTPLTTIEKLRTRGPGAGTTVFGWLVEEGEVRACLHRLPTLRVNATVLSPDQSDALAAHLVDAGLAVSGVSAVHDTSTAFAEAWRRRTGATSMPTWAVRLHRLGALTPPDPFPEGRRRTPDREEVIRWCGEFVVEVGEAPGLDAEAWAGSRFADKHFAFWEVGGTPVAMAASTTMVAGMVRVDPVYTPPRFRGRGHAGAVTAEVSRAALAAGATDVVLFTDPANPTSNALYRRLGYVPIADFTGHAFA